MMTIMRLWKKSFLFVMLLVMTLLSVVMISADLDNDIVHYYSFDNDTKTGSDFLDSANTSYKGIDGGSVHVTGHIGDAVNFTGTGKNITLNDTSTISNNGSFTISFWMKTKDTSGKFDMIGSSGAWENAGFKIDFNHKQGDGSVLPGYSTTIAEDVAGNQHIYWVDFGADSYDGSWHHYVYMWNGSSGTGGDIWQDNVSASPTVYTTYTDALIDMTLQKPLSFGDMYAGYPAGKIAFDEIGIWRRMLSLEEISDLYTATSGYPFTQSTAPTITLITPTNNQHNNNQVNNINFTFNATSDTYDLLNCTHYINGTAGETVNNQNFTENNIYGFINTTTLAEGAYNWLVMCTDGSEYTNSSTYNLVIDNTNPTFTTLIPASDNSTRYLRERDLTSNMSFSGYWTDLYMFAFNHTITNQTTEELMFTWNKTNLSGSVEWANKTINMSTWEDGVYVLNATGSDDHTKKKINDYRYDIVGDSLMYETDTNLVVITEQNGALKKVGTTKKVDRYEFSYEPLTKRQKYDFLVECDDKLYYRGELWPFPSFVCGGNWIDFNTSQAKNYKVKKVDDYSYEVSVKLKKIDNKPVKFNSIGGTNIASFYYEFEIYSNTPPTFSGFSWSTDPINNKSNATASLTYNDADSHPGNITFEWYVDGVSTFTETKSTTAGAGVSSTLTNDQYTGGNTLIVMYNASDGYNVSGWFNQTVTVVNTSFFPVFNMTARNLWNNNTVNNFTVSLDALGYQENASESDDFSSLGIDSNWSTEQPGVLLMNYSKPYAATRGTTKWQLKYHYYKSGFPSSWVYRTVNVTFPVSCWDAGNKLILRTEGVSNATNTEFRASCYNTGGWMVLERCDLAGPNDCSDWKSNKSIPSNLSEEGVFWNNGTSYMVNDGVLLLNVSNDNHTFNVSYHAGDYFNTTDNRLVESPNNNTVYDLIIYPYQSEIRFNGLEKISNNTINDVQFNIQNFIFNGSQYRDNKSYIYNDIVYTDTNTGWNDMMGNVPLQDKYIEEVMIRADTGGGAKTGYVKMEFQALNGTASPYWTPSPPERVT